MILHKYSKKGEKTGMEVTPYSYSTTDIALISSMLGVWFFVVLLLSVFMIVCQWKIFAKAGEDGWKALIPFYNSYILYKIVWGNGWFVLLNLLVLVPLIGWLIVFVISIKLCIDIAKKFGKSTAFGVGLVLIPYVFYAILAFGQAKYQRFPNVDISGKAKMVSKTDVQAKEELRQKLSQRQGNDNHKSPFES